MSKDKWSEEDYSASEVLDELRGMTSTDTIAELFEVIKMALGEVEVMKFISGDVYLDAVNRMEGN
jgi:hypothetical protein